MTDKLETNKIIARMEAQFSSKGLFARYVRSRQADWTQRQIMTLVGSLTLSVLISPFWGLLVFIFAFGGDAFELWVLRHSLRKLDAGGDIAQAMRFGTYAGAVQAVCLSMCLFLTWALVDEAVAFFFCFAFLSVAATNAGMIKPLHRRAILTKLWIFALSGIGCILWDLTRGVSNFAETAFTIIAACALGFNAKLFIEHIETHFKRHRAGTRDLLRRQKLFELGALELQDKQKELRMLSMVARHANDSIILSDAERRITWVNDAFTRITGYSVDEAVGKRPGELLNAVETDLQKVAELDAAVLNGAPFRAELQNQTKDGRSIWIETNVVPILDDEGQVEMVLAVERDITEAKAQARELARARLDAERGERAKSNFLATVSHEIRTPMNGIIGMADLLEDTHLDSEQRHYTKTIGASAHALLRIINDILDFTKLDADRMPLDPIDFSPGQCILDIADLMQGPAKEKDLFLDVNFDTRLPACAHGDDGRLRQMLINLVGNAIKFTHTGGISINVSHSETSEGIALNICVRDTGIGIEPDKLATIFDHFSQADAATTREFGGTGLGLAICKRLAEQMGGSISAHSDGTQGAQSGSEFRLSVKLKAATGAERPAQTTGAAGGLPDLGGLRVLLAEDNKTNRDVITRFLTPQGIELRCVENGRLAVAAAQEDRFDCVLMDMSMPEMDGITATRAIRDAGVSQLPIIALTANAFATDKQKCLTAGMNGFLSKPVRKLDLLETIATHVAKPPPLDDTSPPWRDTG